MRADVIELKALDFDLLRFLVESAPNVVNPDVLPRQVWGRHFVSPENVAQRVMLLRQSLADDANKPRYIETVRNKGYRLIPVVERAASGRIRRCGATPLACGRPRRLVCWSPSASPRAAAYWLAGTAGTAATEPNLDRRAAVRELEPRTPTTPFSQRGCRTRSSAS